MGSDTQAAKPFTILTAEQFAERIHASHGWVRRNAESLGGVKIARKWLFSETTLAGWFDGRVPTIGRHRRRARVTGQPVAAGFQSASSKSANGSGASDGTNERARHETKWAGCPLAAADRLAGPGCAIAAHSASPYPTTESSRGSG